MSISSSSSWADPASAPTSDKLWLLSARELFGDIDWYGASLPYNDIFNAEGEQYQLFREAGLVSDPSNAMLVKNFLPASSSNAGFAPCAAVMPLACA